MWCLKQSISCEINAVEISINKLQKSGPNANANCFYFKTLKTIGKENLSINKEVFFHGSFKGFRNKYCAVFCIFACNFDL